MMSSGRKFWWAGNVLMLLFLAAAFEFNRHGFSLRMRLRQGYYLPEFSIGGKYAATLPDLWQFTLPGGETSLVRLAADGGASVGRPCVLYGGVRPVPAVMFDPAKDDSLLLFEIDAAQHATGRSATLIVPRGVDGSLRKLAERDAASDEGNGVRLLVLTTSVSRDLPPVLTVLDWQQPGENGWGPWLNTAWRHGPRNPYGSFDDAMTDVNSGR